MKKEPMDIIKNNAKRVNFSSKQIGWIVAAILLIYFNTGIRAFAADINPAPAQLDWNTSLKHFQVDSDKFVGQQFSFNCPERTVRDTDEELFGTNVYPSDSPICVAAVHSGTVKRDGGKVRVQLYPGVEYYMGSDMNNVQSGDFPETQRSIVFVGSQFTDNLNPVQRDYAPRLKWKTKFTSTGLANNKLVGQEFTFHCPEAPANLNGRRVYGTDRYAFNSYLCVAAVHAGRLTHDGGFVTVRMEEPKGALKGSIRNGIESKGGPAGTRQLVFPDAQTPLASAF